VGVLAQVTEERERVPRLMRRGDREALQLVQQPVADVGHPDEGLRSEAVEGGGAPDEEGAVQPPFAAVALLVDASDRGLGERGGRAAAREGRAAREQRGDAGLAGPPALLERPQREGEAPRRLRRVVAERRERDRAALSGGAGEAQQCPQAR
jgi:hypothetical protein